MSLPYDQVHVRELLLRDKGFLLQLYKNNTYQNKKLISGADEYHLDTLIKVCHLILNNEIPVFEDDIAKIKKAKRIKLLTKYFKSNKDFLEVLEGQRQNKVQILLRFSSIFGFLLTSLFEE